MTARYLVLGQVAPLATTSTVLYTVPAGKDAVVSTIVVANRSASAGTFTIAIVPSNVAPSEPQNFIAFNVPIVGADSTTLTLGITLSAGQTIRVQASSADMTFNAFGSEIAF
jgi:hypothetical protein